MAVVFVYVLSLLGDEWLKLGMSGDPLRRAQEFSHRYFDLFDFDAAFLIETEGRRDAGRIELSLRRSLSLNRAPVPATVHPDAGGHTEWLRGAYPALLDAGQVLSGAGYELHLPARSWYAAALWTRREALHSWASAVLAAYGFDPDHPTPQPFSFELETLLRNTVDAFHHFGWHVGAFLPPALSGWYAKLPGPKDKSFNPA